MALTPEIETQILRYYHAEHWPIGTIATQLHVHRDSVARVLSQAGLPALGSSAVRRRLIPTFHSSRRRFFSSRVCAHLGSTRWSRIAATPGAPITFGI